MGNLAHADLFPTDEWDWFKTFSNLVSQRGATAYWVGGSVRDLLLAKKVHELDLEVFGLESSQLEEILGQVGAFDSVGKVYGIYKVKGLKIDIGLPRREEKTGYGHRAFTTQTDTQLSLEEAAARRDFTINALYYNPITEEIKDPFGGEEDLSKRLLRHCSSQFSEDPLRVLRAMQFLARFDLSMAPETLALCQSMTPENLSKERFFSEWEKLLLKGKSISKGLNFLNDCGWLRYYPELEALVGCEQDPQWHPEGDVWKHTLHCMDAFATQRKSSSREALWVGLATLCHDLGKPKTTTRKDGKIISHGHEKAGVKPTRTFCERIGLKQSDIPIVEKLVATHMRPAQLFRDQASDAAIRRLSLDAGRIDLLVQVQEADSAGRPPLPSNGKEVSEWLLERAERLSVKESQPKPILQGRHLIDLKLKPGKHFKPILEKAYQAQIEGSFSNLEEAKEWLHQNGFIS